MYRMGQEQSLIRRVDVQVDGRGAALDSRGVRRIVHLKLIVVACLPVVVEEGEVAKLVLIYGLDYEWVDRCQDGLLGGKVFVEVARIFFVFLEKERKLNM